MHIKQPVILITLLIISFLAIPFLPLTSAGAADLTITVQEPGSALYHTPDGDVIAGGGQTSCTIRMGRIVVFAASGAVRLKPGFHAKDGSKFHALISNTTDTDNDGMHDWWELVFGLDPTINDSGDDLDSDGLTNGEEFTGSTLPDKYEAPQIISFDATPPSINQGASSHLAWDIKYAQSVIFNPGNHSVSPTGGADVAPLSTTTYTITATGPGGSASKSLILTVSEALPKIIFFNAFPLTIVEGASSKLSWTAINASSVTIDNGIGQKPLQSDVTVTPNVTTTYTLTATNSEGSTQASVMVNIQHSRPVVTISASPIIVVQGSPTTLTWQSSNATSASIDNGIGTVSPSGTISVTPNGTKIYTITATGPGGTAEDSVLVGDDTDTDGDGIPDVWETTNGMNPNFATDADEDFDGDLLSNRTEYLEGKNPYAYDDDDRILSGALTGNHSSGGKIFISPAAGQQTVLSGTASLKANCTIILGAEMIIPRGSEVTITAGDCDQLPDEWELEYLGTLDHDHHSDPDGDGLTNSQEYMIKSDPDVYKTDNDNDGLNDQWELEHFGNLNQEYDKDFDLDGIENWVEQMIGSNPTDPADYPKPGNYYEYDAVGRIKRVIRIN